MTTIVNILTVDVEDWIQSVYDNNAPLTEHFIANTHTVLEHFAERGVRATFFVLGLAAEKSPELVRAIQSAGHEVQSHGYRHRLVTTQTPTEFLSDVRRSQQILEDITGRPITGYRAPAFSIGRGNLWALDALADCGMQFDASLCPALTPRYGLPGIPRVPHRLRTPAGRSLIELPTATLNICGRLLPAGGGGYARLWPYRVLRNSVRQLNAMDAPAVLYFHPYEFNSSELGELNVPIPLRTRWHQSLGRRRLRARLDRLIRSLPFGSVADWRAAHPTLPDYPLSALNGVPLRGTLRTTAAVPT